jgi:hypothetical protein
MTAILDLLESCAVYVGVDSFLTLIFGPAIACTGILACVRPKAVQAVIGWLILQNTKVPIIVLVTFAALAPWNDPIPIPIWARACATVILPICILLRRLWSPDAAISKEVTP